MFERFTERARQVVVLAQDEARALKHNYIGTEHLLLGLLREEEGIAARILDSFDVTLEEVRAHVMRIVGQGDEIKTGQIPFTPNAKKVLELGLREALTLGHNYIGTEHVLLGLACVNDGLAARILLDFDADAEAMRGEVIRLLAGPSGHRVPWEPSAEELEAARAERPEVAAELDRVRGEKEEALSDQDFERAAVLRDQERRLRARLLDRPEPPVRLPWPGRTYRSRHHEASGLRGEAVFTAVAAGWRRVWIAGAVTALGSAALGLFLGWLIWA